MSIPELLFLRLTGELTPEQQLLLDDWVRESDAHGELYAQLQDEATLAEWLAGHHPQVRAEREERVYGRLQQLITDTRVETDVPVYHIDRRTRSGNWWKYAAAATVVLAIGAYLWNTQQQEKPQNSSLAETQISVPLKNDVAPGGNRAMLTLADGRKIILDSVTRGTIAQQQGANIVKSGEGSIVYTRLDADRVATISYNTMSTPRGGQYQLTLPDGSRVWLNAESSITYPTAFTGKQRNVSIVGEAYFEVAKDKTKPFIVSIQNNFDIEVLGTHFNVNAYADEKTKNTTLLEGSVRIKTVHTSLVLRPGQQGQFDLSADRLSLAVPKDASQAIAWTNGIFNFNNVTLVEAMRQLSRWYDVEVVYERDIPSTRFGGEMGRDLTLSQVLKALSTMGVHFRIEGKKLLVQ